MKKIPAIFIIVVVIIILTALAVGYFLFISPQQEPTLSSTTIAQEQQNLDALNAKHDIPAQWKEGSVQSLGIYQGYEVLSGFLCFGQTGTCPDNGAYYLTYRNVNDQGTCTQLQGKPITYTDTQVHFIGCGVTQGISATTATTGPITGQYTLQQADNGKTFQYNVTSRFDVILDGTTNQPGGVTCSPDGIIQDVPNIPQVSPPLFAQRFEVIAVGTCTLSDGNFSATIQVQ